MAHLDALGRTFLTIEDNGAAGIHATRLTLDLEGNPLRITDAHGNGTTTTYAYDPETFRLVRLETVRDSDDEVLQNLAYTYDPVGNITEIKDSAQQTVFFDNDVVTPSTRYVYDALYRLIQATGREHAGGMADVQRDQNDVPLRNLPHANDAQAVRNYIEQYVYDAVGNIVSMRHTAGAGRGHFACDPRTEVSHGLRSVFRKARSAWLAVE